MSSKIKANKEKRLKIKKIIEIERISITKIGAGIGIGMMIICEANLVLELLRIEMCDLY